VQQARWQPTLSLCAPLSVTPPFPSTAIAAASIAAAAAAADAASPLRCRHLCRRCDLRPHHHHLRDAKLTRLLQGSLGGNARTALVVTAPHTGDASGETLAALGFAARALRVSVCASVNVHRGERSVAEAAAVAAGAAALALRVSVCSARDGAR
jgi:Kinesin motor domain